MRAGGPPIAQAIATRQSEIDRLQAEISPLNALDPRSTYPNSSGSRTRPGSAAGHHEFLGVSTFSLAFQR